VSDSDFSRLQELLLSDDRRAQQQLAQRLAEVEGAVRGLPKSLPQTIEQSDQHGPRLGRALLKPVAAALSTLARDDKQLFVSVLFPVIGPIIRRAIADALSSLLRNLNRTLELSLSWRSWRWRLEARRTGVPFAQVVLKHTLAYRIEHLLWIESGSGLLLAHATNSEAAIADRDAIAGMLTAISDFVRDAVLAKPDESLDRVEMGEFSVRLLRTPQAYLAAVVRGEPSGSVLDGLRALSEQLHGDLPDEPRSYSSASEASLADWLAQSGQSEALREGSSRKGVPWLALGVIVLIVLLLAWTSYRSYTHVRQVQQLRTQVQAQPGIRLSQLQLEAQVLRLSGERDPLAISDAELAKLLGLAPSQLSTRWRTVHSLHPQILLRRLRQRLNAPAGVFLELRGERLHLSGHWPQPPADLDARLEAYRVVIGVDDELLRGEQPQPLEPVAPRLDPQQWQSRADAARLRFEGGASDVSPAQLLPLQALIAEALRLQPQARFRVLGGSDGSGRADTNARLRAARAQALYEALLAAGVDPAVIELDPEGESTVEVDADARSARVQLISEP
jgi:outer membrane protein OmpA-like peptidoglycan-associated protein